MADLSANAPLRIWGQPTTRRFILDTSAARTVYKGQPMIVDQSVDATGNIVQFVDAVVVAADDVFVGIAAEAKSVASGGAETLEAAGIEVYIEPTIVGFKSTVFTDGASVGLGVYMTDSATLAGIASVADNPVIGKLMWVEDGYAYVKLQTAICTGA
jgi:hypothetical protein